MKFGRPSRQLGCACFIELSMTSLYSGIWTTSTDGLSLARPSVVGLSTMMEQYVTWFGTRSAKNGESAWFPWDFVWPNHFLIVRPATWLIGSIGPIRVTKLSGRTVSISGGILRGLVLLIIIPTCLTGISEGKAVHFYGDQTFCSWSWIRGNIMII